MDEIDKTKLSDQTKFRLSEIIGIENYFCQEINQEKFGWRLIKNNLAGD